MRTIIYLIIASFSIWSVVNVPIVSAATNDKHQHEEEGHHDEVKENEHTEDSHKGHDHGSEVKKKEHDRSEHEGDTHGKEADTHDGNEDHQEKSDSHEGHDDHEEKSDSHEGHDDHGEEGVISLDEEARSMIQLQTEKASKKTLGGHLKVYGKIAKDTENYSYITFAEEGKVTDIKVDLGSVVDKDTDLVTIRKSDGSVEIIKSEIHGIVFSIFVKPGDKVDSLTSLLSIIDVDTMRATIDIYERDLRLVSVGQEVVLTTAAYSNKLFTGKVVYISPQVDEHTQAIKVRVDIDNPEHLLRLGMFVSGELIYSSDKKVLAIPATAVQQLNEESVVFVAEKGNDLKVREVILGRSVNDYVEVKKGLSEGEVVVTQGSFYLKSEQAKEAFGDGHNH